MGIVEPRVLEFEPLGPSGSSEHYFLLLKERDDDD